MPALKKTAAPAEQRRPRTVDPAVQKVINRILKLRQQGLGFPSIATKLNDEGVATFGKGDKWYPPVVRGICVRNGVEKGEKKS